ncbi:MAG TPA: CAP domain-containing protein [Candidatus Limnocylindrales bacterium]
MALNAAALRPRLLAVLAAGLLALGIVGPATVSAVDVASSATISANESTMLSLLTRDRSAHGLVAARTDTRLMAIARARSADMAAKGYFSHTQPDGRNIFDILGGDGIAWYAAGENIAWDTYSIGQTTSVANSQWMNSAGHRAIILSSSYNYVGVGLAVASNGRNYWTAVFMKGPDRTGAKAAVGSAKVTTGPTSSTRRARISWTGADIRLQVLTAGFHYFTVERRIDGGAWTRTWSATTLTAATFTVSVGHRTEFRISAVDKKGNRGTWVSRVVDLR